jgi:hypothetical protein
MTHEQNEPQPGDMVFFELPQGFLDDLPEGDQDAIREVIGRRILLRGYDEYGRAELEFVDRDETLPFIYVERKSIRLA